MSNRIMLNVIVDLDRVPGTFSTPDSARESIEAMLLSRIGHYNPVVMLAPENRYKLEQDLVFDKTNLNWQSNQEANRLFVRCQLNWARDVIRMKGHLFLNDLREMLGLPATSEGVVLGWTDAKHFQYSVTTNDDTDDGASIHIHVAVGGNIQHEI